MLSRIVTVLLLSFIFISSSQAKVLTFFKAEKVTIVIQGADLDAEGLYDILQLPEEDQGMAWGKKFKTPNQEMVFVCAHSKNSMAASCTLSFKKSEGIQIDEKRKELLISLKGEEASEIHKLFSEKEDLTVNYFSQDHRLNLKSSFESFKLTYK